MTTPSPDRDRLEAYAGARSAIVSGIWVTLGVLAAMALGLMMRATADTDLAQFMDDPEDLTPWMFGGAIASGVIAGSLVFVPLYLFLLRRSDFGTGKAALMIFGGGLFGALAATFLISLPNNRIALTALIHREAGLEEIRSFTTRANAPDLVNPLSYDSAADALDTARKARVLRGLIAERQASLRDRRAKTRATLNRLSARRPATTEAVGKLTAALDRDDARFARYWSLNMDYFAGTEGVGDFLAAHRSDWRIEKGELVFIREGVLGPYRRRIDRLDILAADVDRSIAEINRANAGRR